MKKCKSKKRLANGGLLGDLGYGLGQAFDDPTFISSLGLLDMVVPGLGSTASNIAGSIEFSGKEDPMEARKKQLDSRYVQHLAMGGPIIQENPMVSGRDTIPTDVMGNPSIVSGNKTVAMTDAGEMIWNGYVFSQDNGYAKRAKDITKKYKFRLGDKFDRGDIPDQEAMNMELTALMQEQEATRPRKGGEGLPAMAGGGDIWEQYLDDILAQERFEINMEAGVYAPSDDTKAKFKPGYIPPLKSTREITPDEEKTLAPSSIPFDLTQKSPFDQKLEESGLLDLDASTLGTLGQVGSLIARGMNLDKPKLAYNEGYVPKTVDLSQQRFDASRQAVGSKREAMRNYKSPAARIAAVTAIDEQLASVLGQSYLKQDSTNADILNRAAMFNSQMKLQNREINAREEAAYHQMIDSLLADMGTYAAGISTDAQKKEIQKKLYNLYDSRNFGLDPETFSIYLKS